jgi:hypothetical protein
MLMGLVDIAAPEDGRTPAFAAGTGIGGRLVFVSVRICVYLWLNDFPGLLRVYFGTTGWVVMALLVLPGAAVW